MDYDQVMDVVLTLEGGFSDPDGEWAGPVNYGVTQSVLADWRGVDSVSSAEVRDLGKAEAAEIFRARYWQRIRGEELPTPVNLIVMDGAVTHGPGRMARVLQHAVRATEDGSIGPRTLAAVQASVGRAGGDVALAVALAEARKSIYLSHPRAGSFVRGWRRRLNDVMAHALHPLGAHWDFDRGLSPARYTPGASRPRRLMARLSSAAGSMTRIFHASF